jgi:hypothetical protein
MTRLTREMPGLNHGFQAIAFGAIFQPPRWTLRSELSFAWCVKYDQRSPIILDALRLSSRNRICVVKAHGIVPLDLAAYVYYLPVVIYARQIRPLVL